MALTPQALKRAQLRDAVLYWLLIPACFIASGLLLDGLLLLPPAPRGAARTEMEILLMALGLCLIHASMKALAVRGEGTPNPKAPPRRLVTAGVYGLCRHPMFWGYDLCALAVVLALGSWSTLLVSYPLFLALQCRFLRKEERILTRRFGEGFERYRHTVPFLFPSPATLGRFFRRP